MKINADYQERRTIKEGDLLVNWYDGYGDRMDSPTALALALSDEFTSSRKYYDDGQRVRIFVFWHTFGDLVDSGPIKDEWQSRYWHPVD